MSDDIDTSEETRDDRLRRNNSADPEGKTHEDEANPMHADSWSGGSVVPNAKKVARGEAPRDQDAGPNTPAPSQPATSSQFTRPWSPEPTEPDTTGSTEGVTYAGKPRGVDAVDSEQGKAGQAPPTTSPQEDEPDGGGPPISKEG